MNKAVIMTHPVSLILAPFPMSRDSLPRLTPEQLSPGCEIEYFSPPLTIYSLIPPVAKIGWKIEIYDDTREIVSSHFHKLQTQLIMVLEGSGKISYGTHEATLVPGQVIAVPPQTFHKIVPVNCVRLLVIDTPGFPFPEDIYYENPLPQQSPPIPFVTPLLKGEAILDKQTTLCAQGIDVLKIPPEILETYYISKIQDQGYDVYLLTSDPVGDKWSIAILDVWDAHQHFHKIGNEHFIVLNGELDITLDGIQHILTAGQSVHIPPGIVHHLKSTSQTPVRLLCINFPAFNPKDFHPLEM